MDGDPAPWGRGYFVLWLADTGYWELHDPDGGQVAVKGFGLFRTVRRRDRAEAQLQAFTFTAGPGRRCRRCRRARRGLESSRDSPAGGVMVVITAATTDGRDWWHTLSLTITSMWTLGHVPFDGFSALVLAG